jgi:hypothetical protein
VKALLEKFLGSWRAVAGSVVAAAVAAMALLLRRRTAELRTAKIESLEAKENLENGKLESDIATLEGKVDADEKERLKNALLLRHLLDDGNDDRKRD